MRLDRKTSAFVVLAAAAGLWLAAGTDAGGLKKSDSQVKASADASKVDAGKQTITITLAVEDGWYIYANPVNNKEFDDNKTVVRVLAGKKELDAKITYPAGKMKSLGDINYSVYTGKVQIRADVERPTDVKELNVQVRLSACNEKGLCLLPATVKLMVP